MARRTHLEELQQFISDERLNDPDMLAALQAQGIDTSGLTTGESTGEETGASDSDAAETETLDAESPDAQLAELQAESDALVETHQERLARDRLKEEQSFKAAQQAAADELQHTLGSLQKVRQDTTGNVRSRVNALSDRLGSMATPGGIGVPLTILLALVVFLIPVMTKGGESEPRFIWAWKVLTRKAQLMPEAERARGAQEGGNGKSSGLAVTDDAASVLALPTFSASNFSQYFKG